MNDKFLGLSWLVWGGGALLVALIFAFVWPQPKAMQETSGLSHFLLRWAHALVWLLLGISLLLRGGLVPGGERLANPLSLLAGLLYLAFIIALVRR